MNSDHSSDSLTRLSSSTDAELLHAIKAGQTSALGILYNRYGKFVYGLALHILKNYQEAENLTQEVFLALQRQDNYDTAAESFRSFLTAMTRSRAFDKLRSRGSPGPTLKHLRRTISAHPTTSPFERASSSERSQKIQNALAQLSEDQRQILEMFYYEGLSQAEIAQRLNIPPGTVKTCSRLGLLKLRQTLEDFMR